MFSITFTCNYDTIASASADLSLQQVRRKMDYFRWKNFSQKRKKKFQNFEKKLLLLEIIKAYFSHILRWISPNLLGPSKTVFQSIISQILLLAQNPQKSIILLVKFFTSFRVSTRIQFSTNVFTQILTK